jgi:hypothetical protein
MADRFSIQSVCECQALLGAELDENYLVTAGWAHSPGTARESAPANSVGATSERFDVVWQCPLCGRNTLRVFYRGALKAQPAATDS